MMCRRCVYCIERLPLIRLSSGVSGCCDEIVVENNYTCMSYVLVLEYLIFSLLLYLYFIFLFNLKVAVRLAKPLYD